jgi:pimeloyl-ACP methyl ester carboxylesterase
MRFKIMLFVAALMTFLSAVFVGALFYISDLLLFPYKPREKWLSVETIECSKWLRETAFGDLSQGHPATKPVDLSCDEALNLPAQSFYTKNSRSERIHYKIYENLTEQQKNSPDPLPLLLHIHGVSGSHLHGARYFKMAARLGFQLAALDLSNHGLSDHNGLGASYGCREQDDVIAVVDALNAQFAGRKILLHSTSMGSMATVNAAAVLLSRQWQDGVKPFQALVLENTIPSVSELVLSSPQRPNVPQTLIDLGVWLSQKRGRVEFDSCAPMLAAPRVTVPTYFLNSTDDDVVSPEVSRKLADALPLGSVFRRKVFDRGRHSAVWNGQPAEVEKDIADLWASIRN